ncbi:MAG: restriction endonuclease subunit S [Bacteroidia bacterium]|nr:restriction endonuclease subunit S [Bacteroidia bacterium]
MNKEKKNTLTPKLRFPEFREEGEWEDTQLSELGKLIAGLTYSPDDIRENGLLVLRASNIQNSEIVLDDCVYVTPNIKGANLSMPNDILICVRNGSKNLIGKNALIPEGLPLCTHGAFMTVFRSKSPNFVYQLFKTDSYYAQVSSDLGATINSINGSQFVKYKFYVPKLPEQQKIAACLTALDDLITAQNEKLKTLQTHKKGLMQQLFPAEGETVPRVRFGEFEGEWEEKPLEKVATFLKGKGISKSDINSNGVLPCIRYGELYTYYNETIGTVKSYTNLPKDDLVLSQANDVIIPASGETKEDIATASCVTKSGIALGGDLNIIRTKINGIFLSYYLNNAKKKEIAQLAQGISVVHLYPGQLQKLKINTPKENEQQKIADCLTSLDDLIRAQSQKLETLKTHKKGLMQQLFPNPNETEE